MTPRLRTATRFLLLALAASGGARATAAAPASEAAPTLIVVFARGLSSGPVDCPEWRLLTIDVDRARLVAVRTAPGVTMESSPYVTPDAAVILWLARPCPATATGLADRVLLVHSMRTGESVTVPLRNGVLSLAGHPRRPEVYLGGFGPAEVLSARGSRPLPLDGCGVTFLGAMSADGSRLVLGCGGTSTIPDTVILDTASGTVVSRTTGHLIPPTLSRDGQHALSLTAVESGGLVLRRHDAVTWTTMAEATLASMVASRLVVHPALPRIIVVGAGGSRTFDSETLQLVASSAEQFEGGWALNPATSHALVVTRTDETTSPPFLATLSLVDIESLRRLASVDLGSYSVVTVAAVPLPAAPVGLHASVHGAGVELQWSAGPSVATTTRHVIEVGSGPGLRDIIPGLEIGPRASFGASGVPPGRYYVRVLAGNDAGLGAPSSEVVVQVP